MNGLQTMLSRALNHRVFERSLWATMARARGTGLRKRPDRRGKAGSERLILMISMVAMGVTTQSTVGAAHGQGFPQKTVRIVVPTAPGGSLDIVTRLIARKLNDSWRYGAIVENRAGAGGVIGGDAVAKASPDGYTIAFVSSSFTARASVDAKLPYDSLRDFAPVTLLGYSPWVLVVHPSVPVRSMQEFVAFAKKHRGELNYGSTGTGAAIHLAGELLKRMAGIDIRHIPYKGTALALSDVIGGRIELTITGLAAAMAQAAGGKLRFLAVTGKKRSTMMPELPTIGETVPGYAFDNWFGVLAPGATPKDVVVRLHDSIVGALQAKDVRKVLLDRSIEPVGSSPAEFGEALRNEIGRYTKLAREIRLRVD